MFSSTLPRLYPSCFFLYLPYSTTVVSLPLSAVRMPYLPLLRVASSVQQISVLPVSTYAFRLSIAAFTPCVICIIFHFRICLVLLSFCSCFLVLLVLLCSRTRHAGISLAVTVELRLSVTSILLSSPVSKRSVTTESVSL